MCGVLITGRQATQNPAKMCVESTNPASCKRSGRAFDNVMDTEWITLNVFEGHLAANSQGTHSEHLPAKRSGKPAHPRQRQTRRQGSGPSFAGTGSWQDSSKPRQGALAWVYRAAGE